MSKTVLAACLGFLFSAVDIVLLILFQGQVAESLAVPVKTIGIAIGVGLLGSAVGGITFAQLGDRYGRVRALGWCVILYSLATAGMALAPNVGALMAMRFLGGIGTGGEWSVGFALIAEVSPRGGRGRRGGLVAAMFNIGTFLAIGLFQAKIGWRAAFAVMALPALGALWLRLSVPESPMWLELQRQRSSGAVDASLRAALERAPVSALLTGPYLAITIKFTLIFALMNLAFYSFSTTFINYLQQKPTDGGLGLDTRAQLPYHAILNGASMLSAMMAGFASDRVGRRLVYSLLCLVGAAGSSMLFLITRGAGAGAVPDGLILAFTIITAAYGINGVIGTIASELFPTHLRSTGPGFTQNLGKGLGGMAGPPVAGILVLKLGYPVVLAIPGALMLLLAALIFTLPALGGREIRSVEDDSYLERATGS